MIYRVLGLYLWDYWGEVYGEKKSFRNGKLMGLVDFEFSWKIALLPDIL